MVRRCMKTLGVPFFLMPTMMHEMTSQRQSL